MNSYFTLLPNPEGFNSSNQRAASVVKHHLIVIDAIGSKSTHWELLTREKISNRSLNQSMSSVRSVFIFGDCVCINNALDDPFQRSHFRMTHLLSFENCKVRLSFLFVTVLLVLSDYNT
jgi:hypothetical protein